MQLICNPALADHLHSPSQKVRVITEAWFAGEGYCLNCMSNRLNPTIAGTVARDYLCPVCGQPYELKSGAGRIGTKVVDGAYGAMMGRIHEGLAPNLLLLRYTPDWLVTDLTALHAVFLTPTVVEARPPLAPSARRAGWVGCNLLLSRIPPDGRIPLVRDGIVMPKSEARRLYAQSERLTELKPEQRGWTALVLTYIRKIGKAEFTLTEVYAFEEAMHAAYPENSHVRDKIRQQLQVLRDLGYLEFPERGRYRMLL
jgi:type II restriction enzyme